MRIVNILLLSVLLSCGASTYAGSIVHIIPQPQEMTVTKGALLLPVTFTIGGTSLPDSVLAEARRFAADYAEVTGRKPLVKSASSPFIKLSLIRSIAPEGYRLRVTGKQVCIEASTTAMAAYPEYSCTPDGKHEVWSKWGISGDVMNVANPTAVSFAKDILDEVCKLFPGRYVHIGGDECPDDAWKMNKECQQLYQKEGLTDYRQLQSRFIKEMADYLRSEGKTTVVWNEAITAAGVDMNSIKAAGVKVFCWNPAARSAKKAAENGLDNVVTFYGPYYINRKQSTAPDEPEGAGNGADSLRVTYTAVPVPADISSDLQKHYWGVQATFWTEHVNDTTYLEYLALPRLLAVAEAGWTAEKKKDYADFRQRVIDNEAYFKLVKFNYCKRDLKAK